MGGRKLWVVCLAVFMLLWGLLQISNIAFAQQGFVMGVLAVAVAVLAFLDR